MLVVCYRFDVGSGLDSSSSRSWYSGSLSVGLFGGRLPLAYGLGRF